MVKLAFLIYPICEFFAIYKFVEFYSFVDFLMATVLFGILGIMIMILVGRSTLLELQKSLAKAELPRSKVLHGALMMLGGFLIFLPGIINDSVGILLVLPGTRHLIVWYLKLRLGKAFLKGTAKFFSAGIGSQGAGFRGGFYTYTAGRNSGPQQERDVEVVEVKPIEISHIKKNEP